MESLPAALWQPVQILSVGPPTMPSVLGFAYVSLISMFLVTPGFYLDVAQDPIFLIGFPALLLLYGIGVFAIRRLVDLKV